MVKVIIQIPCYNEEHQLPSVLAQLPRQLAGVDRVEWLVINDGSTDRTVEVARACGVDHILDLPVNGGLARAFTAGLRRSLEEGADIIVNTDGDNQYDAADIPHLIGPILRRQAEFVIGDRPIENIGQFSRTKRHLQRLGSWVVRIVSGTRIHDAPSGFRALSRDAALRMNVFDKYTYTLESVIQAGLSDIRVMSVPVGVHDPTRPSRLIRSNADYIRRSIFSILRAFLVYKPGKSFFLLGLPPALVGTALVVRWLVLFLGGHAGSPRSHVPSLVAAAVLLIFAGLLWIAGLLGELFDINRRLLQDLQYMMRRDAVARHGSAENPSSAERVAGPAAAHAGDAPAGAGNAA